MEKSEGQVTFVAHRATLRCTLQNTSKGYALLPRTVRAIEIDARLTADEVCVLCHDAELPRSKGVQRRVSDITRNQIIALRSEDEDGPEFLDEFLERLSSRDIDELYVDLKEESIRSVSILANSLRSIAQHITVIVMARRVHTIRQIHERYRGLFSYGLFGVNTHNSDQIYRDLKNLAPHVAFLRHGDDAYRSNRGLVGELRKRRIRVGASVLNDPETIEMAIVDGCERIITDVIDRYV